MLGAVASVIVAFMGGRALPYIKGGTQAWRQGAVVFGSFLQCLFPTWRQGGRDRSSDDGQAARPWIGLTDFVSPAFSACLAPERL